MIGNDMRLDPGVGTCGKDGQSVPVGVGQPTLRIDGLTVGGTVQLEKHSGTTAGRLVNISGRQRMLSQRMAKFYQAIAWGVGDANSAAELEKARKDFVAGHQEMSAAPANTQQIKEGLGLVNQQWMFFENALNQKSGADKKQLTANVATTSERILEEMESVVGQYERLTAK
jgi:hypothetical protein